MHNDRPTDGSERHDAEHTELVHEANASSKSMGYLAVGAVVILVILGLWIVFVPDRDNGGIPVETTNSIDVTEGDVEQEPGAAINDETGN